jgi:hypothetical protein
MFLDQRVNETRATISAAGAPKRRPRFDVFRFKSMP